MSPPTQPPVEDPRRSLATGAVVALIALLAGAVTALLVRVDASPAGTPSWLALAALAGCLVAAGVFDIRFRHGRDVTAVTLEEAVLAPLLFAYPGPAVVATATTAALVTAVLRRNRPMKAAFNIAQWGLAAAVGALVVHALAADAGPTARGIGAVLLALVVVGLVNNASFTVVVTVARRLPARTLLRGLAPVIVPGWVVGFGVNVVLGLLYALAFAAAPAAVLLFPLPLVLLHLAYRGYALARSDRQRLAGLHEAAQALAEPLDPGDGIAPYLQAVARSFESQVTLLVLRTDAGREVHRWDGSRYAVEVEPHDAVTLVGALGAQPGALHVSVAERGPLGELLRAHGARDALAAPLLDDDRLVGSVVALDRIGLQGEAAGELDLFAALARETAAAFAKGRLLGRMLADRARLDQIVSSTSDGITTIDVDGTVRSWNPALEWITGLHARDLVGRPNGLSQLDLRTLDGARVDLGAWALGAPLPDELRLTSPLGPRRLTCSYSQVRDEAGQPQALVVVARDVTPVEVVEQLRREFGRLVEQEAAARVVVEHLQDAVMPSRPTIPGAELAVTYVGSDDAAPTGGDMYDCQLLPSGELHLAVVDVLGHGVAATKDALSVMHTIRTVVLDGTPLGEVVERADVLLGRQDPDLVATVVLARFDPVSGRVTVAAGGHPPALLVTARGEVQQLPAAGGAIGWPGAGSDSVAEAVLEPGDALVLYTDGLVEARKDILAGMEELVGLAAELAAMPAQDAADMLVQRALEGAERRDDTLALVLRRLPVPAASAPGRWQLLPDAQEVSATRSSMTRWLREAGLPPDAVDDATLVAAELLSNAARAARRSITVTAVVEPSGPLILEVSDDGPGDAALADGGREMPSTDSESGRGLAIVRALASDVVVFSSAEGSSVRAMLPLPAPSEAVVPEQALGPEASPA